jgi:sirohydrochlorin ferrochelatase
MALEEDEEEDDDDDEEEAERVFEMEDGFKDVDAKAETAGTHTKLNDDTESSVETRRESKEVMESS